MSKRKRNEEFATQNKSFKSSDTVKKHSLDSDEEDEPEDANNVLHEDDIEGEEDGVSRQEGEIKMTAFNMQEEMEMGHFDRQGHFIWNNEKDVRDNWLDNIDWQKIHPKKYNLTEDDESKGLAEESDSEPEEPVNVIETYEKILTYLKPKETLNKALRRLGGDTTKLSSVERLKRKKAGLLNSNKEVTDLTELINKLLYQTGNMDIYQETYEKITEMIENSKKKNKSKAAVLDMYSDDFEDAEKKQLHIQPDVGTSSTNKNQLQWFFKWEQDKDKVEGPFSTEQMSKWSDEGYFKTGVWVQKEGEDANFYSSNRIDFELYL